MSISTNQAVEDILQNLAEIPLADSTVRYYGFCYQTVLQHCAENGKEHFSYEDASHFFDFLKERVKQGEICETYALIMRKAAFALADYLSSGKLHWGRRSYRQFPLPEHFQRILDGFESSMVHLLSEGSVRLILQMSRKFLLFLVERECIELSDMKIYHISEFISQESPKHVSHKMNLTWPIKKFLHYLYDKNLISINADIFLENPVPARKKVLPCLEDSEIEALFSKVDRSSVRGKRDYAIIKLALDTGMRWSDIASLKLSEINWKEKEISISQKKTGIPLVLPMTVSAGNAIADYILNARPRTDSPYVFLRLRRPYDRLNSRTPAANIMKLYQSDGFYHQAGDGKGFHSFRRTMGTRLIKADIPLTTVSQILGHTNLDSTKRYLFLHDEKLLACCMDLSCFPCRKEGLS